MSYQVKINDNFLLVDLYYQKRLTLFNYLDICHWCDDTFGYSNNINLDDNIAIFNSEEEATLFALVWG